MNQGVPWNVTGVRPDARDVARDAARRSGMSVGDWLNSVIDIAAGARTRHRGQDIPVAAGDDQITRVYDRLDEMSHRLESLAQVAGARAQAEPPADATGGRFASAISQFDERLDRLMSEGRSAALELERRLAAFDGARSHVARAEQRPAPAPVHPPQAASQQHQQPAYPQAHYQQAPHPQMAYPQAPVLQPMPQPMPQMAAPPVVPRGPMAPPPPPAAPRQTVAQSPVDQAIAEIAARQHALDNDSLPQRVAAVAEQANAFAVGRLDGLERQLQHITSQIDTLQRPCNMDAAVNELRAELGALARTVSEASPRRAIEAIEGEIRALAQRVDAGRQSGGNAEAFASIEHGLAELRDALHGLTPAESLRGMDVAIHELAHKIDQVAIGGNTTDPHVFDQIATAINDLQGMLSHVASIDALSELAAEVRTLSSRVEYGLSSGASTGASAGAVSAYNDDVLRTIDEKIGAIADALEASAARAPEPAQPVSPELDSMLRSLTDKLERVQNFQPSRAENVAFGHLEDRLASLAEKLDASEGRLGHLESIERGMAELLVHLEELRSGQGLRAPSMAHGEFDGHVPVEVIKDDLHVLRQSQSASERRTQETLEAVHDTIGNVVDRLAMIETSMRAEDHRSEPVAAGPADFAIADMNSPIGEALPEQRPAEAPRPFAAKQTPAVKPPFVPQSRTPIDPTLPPDHPLEPGLRTRGTAGDAGARSSTLEVPQSDGPAGAGATNFIAAARRAAKAAIGEPSRATSAAPAGKAETGARKRWFSGERVKSLLVGLSVVVIVLGAVRLVLNFIDGDEPAAVSSAPSAPARPATPDRRSSNATVPSIVVPEQTGSASANRQSGLLPQNGPLVLPVPPSGVIARSSAPNVETGTAATPADITGSVQPTQVIPNQSVARSVVTIPPVAPVDPAANALPGTIGAATLRTAAVNGDPAAAYEIAVRYAEGRGVPLNFEEAARWFERAAGGGIVPAQFRLGSLYEKGQGVKKNLVEAQRLYLAAAEKGSAKAMHNLAVLNAEGVDGKPDYKVAAQWFRKAADRDVGDSQYNLGVLYARGIGVEQNLPESYKWFALAARSGDADSIKKRDDVGGRLDAQSLMAAKLAVQTWVAEPQPADATSVKAPPGGWDTPPPKVQQSNKPKPRPKA